MVPSFCMTTRYPVSPILMVSTMVLNFSREMSTAEMPTSLPPGPLIFVVTPMLGTPMVVMYADSRVVSVDEDLPSLYQGRFRGS